ncbi:MAG: cupin domain-containing protein [Actinomycetota bacterium]|nr:cupin domain-containing protein [Actinomycetota bacterium]
MLRSDADPHAFADLLSLDDVDALVSTSMPRIPEFRMVRDGTPLKPTTYSKTTKIGGESVAGVADPGKIYREFATGATLVFQSLQRYWPPLSRFCRSLELDLTHPAQANAYVTPPNARGLAVHHDTHDVFVLHLSGRKRWQIYEPAIELPLGNQRWKSGRKPGPVLLSVELEPGDCLYVPRGFPHSASSTESATAHLTVGVLTYTAQEVVKDILKRTEADIAFRRSLAPGFARDEAALVADVAALMGELRDWLDTVDPTAVAAKIARRFWSTRPPLLAGQLRQLALVDSIDDRSGVRCRPGTAWRIVPAGPGRISLLLGDRQLQMPAALESVVERLLTAGELTVGDLADGMDEKSRLVLVRRLVREGALEILG